MTGYCMKCKSKQELVGAVEVTMKNNRKAIRGACAVCGAAVMVIQGK